MSDKIEGHLEIGTNDKGEVVMNYEIDILRDLDSENRGHFIFSQDQARNLAKTLVKKADEARQAELMSRRSDLSEFPEPRQAGMTPEEHKARHVELHKSLDELLADWIAHSPRNGKTRLPSEYTVMDFLQWSYEQTQKPDDLPTK